MDFRLEVNMGNEAFKLDPEAEICDILKWVAGLVEIGEVFGPIMDHNGNRVGKWLFTD